MGAYHAEKVAVYAQNADVKGLIYVEILKPGVTPKRRYQLTTYKTMVTLNKKKPSYRRETAR